MRSLIDETFATRPKYKRVIVYTVGTETRGACPLVRIHDDLGQPFDDREFIRLHLPALFLARPRKIRLTIEAL